jgi:hypothetical protein
MASSPNDFDELAAQDDALIYSFLNPNDGEIENIATAEIGWGDTVGKADEAVDYEDISDDDLPSEEERPGGGKDDEDEDEDLGLGEEPQGEPAEGEGEGEVDFDDLFGSMDDDDNLMGESAPNGNFDDLNGFGLPGSVDNLRSDDRSRASSVDEDILRSYGMSDDFTMDEAPVIEDPVKLAQQYYPDFQPHTILSFSTIFKPKPGTLQTGPQKVPKACLPTKVNVEMAADEAALFNKQTSTSNKGMATTQSKGIVAIPQQVEEEPEEDEDMGQSDTEKDPMFERDLELACCDWERKIEEAMNTPPSSPPPRSRDEFEEGVAEIGPPVKVCTIYVAQNLC